MTLRAAVTALPFQALGMGRAAHNAVAVSTGCVATALVAGDGLPLLPDVWGAYLYGLPGCAAIGAVL